MSELSSSGTESEPGSDDCASAEFSPWTNVRVVATAAGWLLVFAVAMYAMNTMADNAIVIVEADEVVTVMMGTGAIRLEEVDGPMVIVLRPGRNAVKAGQFRVLAETEGVDLTISPGRELTIGKDAEVILKIESVSDADATTDG